MVLLLSSLTRSVAQVNCPGKAYLFQNSLTDLYEVDLVTGDTTLVIDDILGNESANRTLNAAAFNPVDGYLYAYRSQTNQLVRIDPSTYAVTIITVPGMSTGSYIIGDINTSGRYYIHSPGRDSTQEIDLSDVDGTGPVFIRDFPSTNPTGSDWAFNPVDDFLYSVRSGNNLVKEDTAGNLIFNIPLSGDITSQTGGFGAVYYDLDGNLYVSNNNSGRIFQVPLTHTIADTATTVTSTFFTQGPASSNNDGARCALAVIQLDYGDAPDSYKTTVNSDGPRHYIENDPVLTLGSAVTFEGDALGVDANSDDEDALSTSLSLDFDFSVQVPYTNTLNQTAYVYAWLDLNEDGQFSADEIRTTTVGQGSGDLSFNWSELSCFSDTVTYLRVRISYDQLSDNTATNSLDERSCGLAIEGEVEDYAVRTNKLALYTSLTNVLCNGDLTGEVNLTVTGGSGTYTYLWTGPLGFTSTAPNIGTLAAGSYSVTVTDVVSFCSEMLSFDITENTALGITIDDLQNATCDNDGKGSVILSITGGATPYTYLWSDGATTKDRLDLDPGTYDVTVTDANGCTSVETITIGGGNTIPDTPAAINERICIGTQALLEFADSAAGVTYTWYTSESSNDIISIGNSFLTDTLQESTTFYVSCTIDSTGCESLRAEVFVEVVDFKCNALKQYWKFSGVEYDVTYRQDERLYISLNKEDQRAISSEQVSFTLYRIDGNVKTIVNFQTDTTVPYIFDEQGIDFIDSGAGDYSLEVCQQFAPPYAPDTVNCCYEIPFSVSAVDGNCGVLNWSIDGVIAREYYDKGESLYFSALSDNWTPTPEKVIFRIYKQEGSQENLLDEYLDNTAPYQYNDSTAFVPTVGGIYKVKVYVHLPGGEVCFKQVLFYVNGEGSSNPFPICETLDWQLEGVHEGHAIELGDTLNITVNTDGWPRVPNKITYRLFEVVGLGTENEILVSEDTNAPFNFQWTADRSSLMKVKFYADFGNDGTCFYQLQFVAGEGAEQVCDDLIWSIQGIDNLQTYAPGTTFYPSLRLEDWVEAPHIVDFDLYRVENGVEVLIDSETINANPPYEFRSDVGLTVNEEGFYVLKAYTLLCSGERCFKQVKFIISTDAGNSNTRVANFYPNPAVNTLNVTLVDKQVSEAVYVTLYNTSGIKVVDRQVLTEGEAIVNISGLPFGIYQVVLENDSTGVIDSFKVIKE
ncbi:hypothetical protein GCM10023331_29450 [Algivirga pacifica]|uniref:Secretion system C-terminal sorting domain-containing protein n=2 Tax=Algivirga pacifica TaxID=1162670 RepID=A0ABP9DEH5_9BACT